MLGRAKPSPKHFPRYHDGCQLWGQRARSLPVGSHCHRVLLEVPARGHLICRVPEPGESEMTAREGRSEGLAGKQPGCVLGQLASIAPGMRWGSEGFLQAAPCPRAAVKARENQRERKEDGGDEKSAAPRGNATACERGAGRAQSTNSCSHHRVRSLRAPLPGPGPPVKLPTLSEPALPFGQRWPRRRCPRTAANGGEELPKARARSRGLEEIQSKEGGCPKRLSRLCRDTDGLGCFVEVAEAPSCIPILGPVQFCRGTEAPGLSARLQQRENNPPTHALPQDPPRF